MKKFGKILALTLLIMTALSGCNPNKNSGSSSGGNTSIENENGLKYGSEYLYKSGRSDYKIVIPEAATNYEKDAANELQTLLMEALSYKMPIVTDDNLSISDGKYLSLGNTSLLEESGIEVNNDELRYSGYLIKTLGDDIFMTGSIDGRNVPGTTYAVYEFLGQTLGFRQYTADFYTLDKALSLKIPLFDMVDIPDIDERSLGYLAINTNPNYAKRMRLQQYHGATTGELWMVTGHSMVNIFLPYEVYGESHPEWFCGGEGVMRGHCYSNLEARAEVAKTIIDMAKSNTDARYVQIGMADNFSECFCDLCVENRVKYGSISGIQVDFLNYISDIVTPWLEENQPGRELNIVCFAYHWGEAPPVKQDENGDWVPYHEDLVCRDNVGMMWAPIGADYSKPFTDEASKSFYNEVMGWNALTNVKTAYLYCINFKEYLINFNDFNSIQSNYKFLAENGYSYVYNQANADDTLCGSFEDLRIYVHSRIMWDTDLNCEELVKDFIKTVYGPAAEAVQKYYDITRSWLTILESEGKINGTIFYPTAERSLWPKFLVDSLDAALQEGLDAIQPLKESDPTYYQNLYNLYRKNSTD